MKKVLNFFTIVLFLVYMITTTSCRKELCYLPHPHNGYLDVTFDWGDTQEIPEGVRAVFYDIDNPGNEPLIHNIASDSDRIYLPKGRFNALFFNNDTENIYFRGMELYNTAEAYLERYLLAPFTTRNPEQKSVSQPDLFYLAQMESIDITTNKKYEVTIRPHLKVIVLKFKVSVIGMQYVVEARGSLEGITESIYLSTGKGTIENAANVLFDFQVTPEGITAEVRCFGVLEGIKDKLYIEFLLKDQTAVGYEYDITGDISDAIRENGGEVPTAEILIKIPEIDIKEGGFTADVNDWGPDIDIPLN